MWKLLQLISNSWIIGFVFKVMRVGLLKRNYWSKQYVLLFFSIVSLGLDSHAAKAPWMSAVISFRDSKTIGWCEYVWKNELSSFSSALGTGKKSARFKSGLYSTCVKGYNLYPGQVDSHNEGRVGWSWNMSWWSFQRLTIYDCFHLTSLCNQVPARIQEIFLLGDIFFQTTC